MQAFRLDRRSFGRVPHCGDVLVRGTATTFSRGATRDFTEDGARLVVPEDVPTGTSIVVHLKLEAQRILSLLATVVWAKPAEKGTEVGVRFAEGCIKDRRQLANWVHRQRLLGAASMA